MPTRTRVRSRSSASFVRHRCSARRLVVATATYLLELYGDAQTSSLHHARAEIRLLVLEAVHGAGRRSS